MGNESAKKPSPSILDQAIASIESDEGITAGVVVKDGKAGAELTANVDVGKKGGWMLGAIARTNDKFAALVARWKPGK
jgi:hypothetical protein